MFFNLEGTINMLKPQNNEQLNQKKPAKIETMDIYKCDIDYFLKYFLFKNKLK
jgi:hypothetical protein